MKALPLTVIAVSIILTNGQPPQAWINFKGYWYVLYKGPHPPNVQQAGLHAPPSIHSPVPVRVSVVDNPPPKAVQAAPVANKPPPTPPPVVNFVMAPPPASSAPQKPPAPQSAPSQKAQPGPPSKSQHQASQQQQQISRTLTPAQQQPAPAQQQPTQPKVAPPRQPGPSFFPASAQRPVMQRQPGPPNPPAAAQHFQSSPPFHPSQPRQPSAPRMSAPPMRHPTQRAPSSLGSWNPVPMWNPVPPPPMVAVPSSNPGVTYLRPSSLGNRRPVISPGQPQYSNMVPQRNAGPLPNAFHPGPAHVYPGAPHGYGRGGHMAYRPLEPPDIDIPLTPCGDSILPPTTPSPLLGRPAAAANLDPRCRCEDPQDCDTLTTPDPVCPAWTSCCCRPHPPTIPPAPTNGAPAG